MVVRHWRVLIVSLTIGIVWAPNAVKADFSDGINAYGQGDYITALNEWLPYAAENDSRALYNLGQMYRLGQGVPKDLAIAEQYYRRAAKQGHAAARGNLGSLYFTQQPPKIDEALYYWRSAARGGDVRSQYLLGVQYFNGLHVNRDYVLAYAWVSLAANAGLKEAKESLDVLAKYLGPQDIAEGVRLSKSFGVPLPTDSETPPVAEAPAVVDVAPPRQSEVVVAAEGSAPPDIIDQKAIEPIVENAAPEPPLEVVSNSVAETVPAVQPMTTENVSADRYRVQIAALRSEAEAIDYWQRASQKRPSLMVGISHYIEWADVGARGIYHRLQLGNFSERAAAVAFCQQLQATELSCYVVAAP